MSLLGVFPSLSNEEHHADDAVGSSGLKEMQQSMLHYWSKYRDPKRVRKEPTPAMKIGTAWHAAIFEPAKFGDDYIRIPDGLDRRTKEGKQLWSDIEASGKEPLSGDDFDRIVAMTASAAGHPVTEVLFGLDGRAEVSMFSVDKVTGVRVKIRPDYAVMPCQMFPNGLIVDGKTMEDASPAGFAKQAWNWGFHFQAAFYSDVFQHVLGTKAPPAFVWLAQEKDAPFATAYYSASTSFVDFGRRQYRPLLDRYAQCLDADVWPGYSRDVQPLELPVWAEKQIQEAA